MWVFCGGMYRSGSTLQFQVASRLVEETGTGRRVEWAAPDQFPRVAEKMAGYTGMKVFKSHICTAEIAAEFAGQNAVALYIYRDIREVAASYMRKDGAKLAYVIKSGYLDRALGNYYKWTALNNVLVSKYEDMVSNLTGEVKRTALHLGVSLQEEKYREIAADLSPDKQVQRLEAFKNKAAPGEGGKKNIVDPHTLLHVGHITSGKNDNWKRTFSAAEIELIEKKARDWLLETGYPLYGQAGEGIMDK